MAEEVANRHRSSGRRYGERHTNEDLPPPRDAGMLASLSDCRLNAGPPQPAREHRHFD
jgi:hypothetical protein